MDAIKSYFSRIIPQSHVMRKGSGKWKRDRDRERARFSGLPHRSASTSHVDLDSQDPDMDAIFMGSTRMFSPTLETFRSQPRVSDPHFPIREIQAVPQYRRDTARTPPPSKPPRKDLVFSVQLDTEGLNDIGVEIDCLPSSSNTSHKHKLPQDNSGLSKTRSAEEDESRGCSPHATPGHNGCSRGNAARGQGLTFKVVALTQGSRCNLDGRVKVNDEIVDINGDSLQKETRESARLLLEKAIKSGHVVLTIRRRRKRASGPPAVPARQTSLLQSFGRARSASSDDLCVQDLNCASPSGAVVDPNSRARSLDDSVLPESLPLEESNVDLNISSDDVFADSTTPCDKVTYINLPHLRFHKKSDVPSNGRLPDLVNTGLNKSDKRNNTISTTKDHIPWSGKTPDNSSQPDFILSRDDANTFTESSSTSTLVEESDGKMESSSSSRKESVESTGHQNTSVGQRLGEGTNTCSAPVKTEPSLLRRTENVQHNSGDVIHRMSMSAHEWEIGLPNSPSSKKRVVSKLSLMKDENGLGIHIAGGKGCRKGDIGIFVAALTEGGAAHRDGRIKKGDELLMINGQTLLGMTHQEAVDVLRNSQSLVKIVVASKIKKSSPAVTPNKNPESPRANPHGLSLPVSADHTNKSRSCYFIKTDDLESPIVESKEREIQSYFSRLQDSAAEASSDSDVGEVSYSKKHREAVATTPSETVMKWEELFEKFQPIEDHTVPSVIAPSSPVQHRSPFSMTVHCRPGEKGLGFSVVGGSSSSKGNSGIFVKEIFKQSEAAENGHLRVGDEILEINDQPLHDLTQELALSLFRALKPGPVKFTFRSRTSIPRTNSRNSLSASSHQSRDESPHHSSPASSRNSLNDASSMTKDSLIAQKLHNNLLSHSSMYQERQINGDILKSNNTKSSTGAKGKEMDSSKPKYYSANADKDVRAESFLPPGLNSPKPGNKGRVGVVTPLLYQHLDTEQLNQVNPGQPQNLTLTSKQVIKHPESSVHGQKVDMIHPTENTTGWNLSDRLKYNHQAELEEILKNCTEPSSTSILKPCSLVSSPTSRSVIKMQVKPVETHLAQSLPVLNPQRFKLAGTAVKYPLSDKNEKNDQQVTTSPTVSQKHQPENHNAKSTESESSSKNGVMRVAETRIHPDYQQRNSPLVRPRVNHSSQLPFQNSVDRVDQQLHENRKQIDISSPVIGQRRNCHSVVAPSKSMTEAHADSFSTQSKTLPRIHHQNSLNNCHLQVFNNAAVHQQAAATEDSTVHEQVTRASPAATSLKHSDGSGTPGGYSSLPRGHHIHQAYHQPADHYHVCHNQHVGQHEHESFISQAALPLSSKLSEAEIFLHDLMKPCYGPHLPLKPFDDAAVNFFNHSQAFAKLSSTSSSLMDNNMAFPAFCSPLQAFNQENDMKFSPNSSFKSFSQSSFYKYHSNEATATYQSDSSSEKQSHAVCGNSQSFSKVHNPLVTVPNPLPVSTGMLPPLTLPHMLPQRGMTESAHGHLTSHIKSSHCIVGAQESPTRIQDKSQKFRIEISVIKAFSLDPLKRALAHSSRENEEEEVKDSGASLGINVVRKTVTGISNIFIQDIISGSNVEKDNRLRRGDCLVSVNGVSLKDHTLLDAHELFRNLPSGPVHIIAIRDMAQTAV